MRANEFITEYKQIGYDYPIYQNPSSSDIVMLLDKFAELRGVAFDNTFIVWDAIRAIHNQAYFDVTGDNEGWYESYYISGGKATGSQEDWELDKVRDGLYVGTDAMPIDHPMVRRAFAL